MSLKHFSQVTDVVGGFASKGHRKRNPKTHCFDSLHHLQKVTVKCNRFHKNFKHAKRCLKSVRRSPKDCSEERVFDGPPAETQQGPEFAGGFM